MNGCGVIIVALIVAASGPLCLCITFFIWLRTAEWAPVENLWLIRNSPGLREWLIDPQSWLGLHKIGYFALKYIPLGLVSLPIGFAIAATDWGSEKEGPTDDDQNQKEHDATSGQK
jgi:hypothetical protein